MTIKMSFSAIVKRVHLHYPIYPGTPGDEDAWNAMRDNSQGIIVLNQNHLNSKIF